MLRLHSPPAKEQATATMEQFDIKIERPKPNPIEEVLELLKKILECCLFCVTCGCYQGTESSRRSSSFNGDRDYSSILLDNEKQAVQNLLRYLEDEETRNPVLDENHVQALSILTYSENTDLQRSAALCYSEVSEKMKVPMTSAIATPLVALLGSANIEVKKTAALAVSNFALNGPEVNTLILVDCDALRMLVPLLYSEDIEVQCNASGCITALATTETSKRFIATENGIAALLLLVQKNDVRVQRNAAGALLNLTHIQSNRNDLVNDGAIPILIQMLQSNDQDVQYYCTAALSNLAINEKHRAMMVAVGCHDVIEHLIRLLMSRSERVKCQACFALRNLASDVDTQSVIVQYGALGTLHKCIKQSRRETKSAAMACIRNLSIHKANEGPILASDILNDICDEIVDSANPEAQKHAAGTIRNLTVGDHIRELLDHGCLDRLAGVLLDIETKVSVVVEVTAALAVMADDGFVFFFTNVLTMSEILHQYWMHEVKYKLIEMHDGRVFIKLVTMATLSTNTEVQYNSAGTLGQLALISIPTSLKTDNLQGIVLYIDKFLKCEDPNFVHIALWTLVQQLKDPIYLKAFQDHGIQPVIVKLTATDNPPSVQELAEKVISRLQEEHEKSNSSNSNSD